MLETKVNMIVITDENPTTFISTLKVDAQTKIEIALLIIINQMNLTIEETEVGLYNGMNGRLCDLEDMLSMVYVEGDK